MSTTTTRNATLGDLADMLKDQNARKIDVVAPASTITAEGANLSIAGSDPVLGEDGVTITDGLYLPTSVCDEGVADKLGIPIRYLRKMREERPDLYDANVNGWLREDSRSFLVRCFRADESGVGIARAFLSDKYRVIDNLDVLLSALQGIEDAGLDVVVDSCDLSDRRMYVRVLAPQVQVMAEELLRGYRNPFSEDFERWRRMADREGLGFGGEEPVLFAGLVITNSEVGGGAFSITPRAVVKVCKNGLVITTDIMREVHLGGRLDEGVVDWSSETQQKAAELVRSKTRDAVTTFLSPEYLTEKVEGWTEKATERVKDLDHVRLLTRKQNFTAEQVDGILERFSKGGQWTRGGVVNAVTAHAQTVSDPDEAASLEERALAVLS